MRNLIIFILFIAAIGCTNDKDCKNAICTEIFASISVKLTDSTHSNLSDISTQTILLSTGELIHSQSGPNSWPENIFTVVDDSDLKELGFNTSQKVELKISKDGNLIKTVLYTIKTDCCHVSIVDGPTEVALN
ncbi:MAG: hypothetical protein ACKVQB_11720 [Bacteroidia bacterium]